MSYIEKTLMVGETIVYRARLHWFRYVECWALVAVGAAMIYYLTDMPPVQFLGGLLILAAPVLMFKTWLDQVTSEFVVTEKRVLIKFGFIRRRTLELLLTKVESVGVDQSILGRIFGFGSIIVSGTGGTREPFRGLADPLEFHRQVQTRA